MTTGATTVDLKGGKEIQRELEKLDKKTGEKVLKKHVRTNGNIFLKAIRAETPTETLALRKQTKISVKVLRKVGFVSALVRVKSKKFATGRNPSHYQHLVTGGSSPHAIGGPVAYDGKVYARIRHPGTRPNQYVDRAFDRNVRKVNETLFRDLQRSIMVNP